MANYQTRHTGPAIDASVTKSETLDTAGNGWLKLSSTASSPVDLNTLVSGGNYTVSFFTNGHAKFNSIAPLNICVALVNQIVTQYVFYTNGIMRRTYNNETSTWEAWTEFSQSSFIYIQGTAPADAASSALWIDTSTAGAPVFKIHNSETSSWNTVEPSDMMKKSIYDPNGHATDIFSYIDTKMTELNVSTVTT